jgi:uncharacterized NAD(P)/FAD-binding protein YdhS
MTDAAPRKRIAVIGGGASATLFLAHFLRGGARAAITLYDESGRFHRGIAYSTRDRGHLLNVRARDMSAFHDDKSHFENWAKRHGYGAGDFVPRLLYGAYLEELAEGFAVARRRETASARPDADYIVLCSGNNCPIQPLGAEAAPPGYHADPFTADYEALLQAPEIVILGTGLSMVDAVVSLDGAGYGGRITAISRRGLLPRVHSAAPPPDYPFTAAYPATAARAVRLVRDHLRAAEAQGVSWQGAIGGLRAHTNPIWLALPERERRRLRRALPFWNVHRHRTAPAPGAVVAKWLAGGRLRVARDSVLSVAPAESGAGVAVRCRHATYRAPAAINCLGYGAAVPGGLMPDNAQVFAIGPVNSGRLLETTAIPEIRAQAHEIANQLQLLISA